MSSLLHSCEQGVGKDTRGTAFVVYEDIYDAKMAVEHLSGFNVANRYLIVLYYNPARQTKKVRLTLCPFLVCETAIFAGPGNLDVQCAVE